MIAFTGLAGSDGYGRLASPVHKCGDLHGGGIPQQNTLSGLCLLYFFCMCDPTSHYIPNVARGFLLIETCNKRQKHVTYCSSHFVFSQTLAHNSKRLWQSYSFVEIFCGEAWCSRCMRTAGYATAQMDISLTNPERKPNKQNEMDLLTESGFLQLACDDKKS